MSYRRKGKLSKILILSLLSALPSMIQAQDYDEMLLWPKGTAENNGITAPEKEDDNHIVTNISVGKMYVYHPEKEKNTGAAVIICPGGGYLGEAIVSEGHDFAEWLVSKGVTAIVLKYRLPNGYHYIPLKDAQRAIRTVRHNASSWGVNAAKIGISGFSAGGHLASTAGTHFDDGNPIARDSIEQITCRPDFMILFYPVITMHEEFTHAGSRNNLLGKNFQPQLEQLYSNEEQVTEKTPPTFLILSDDDSGVSPRNSVAFYSALKRFNIPASMHILLLGGHGWGCNAGNRIFPEWSVPLEQWMKQAGFLSVTK